jgi:hypothetical protein
MGNGLTKEPLFAASNRRPLPTMSSARMPDSAPLTLGARDFPRKSTLLAGNLRFGENENLVGSSISQLLSKVFAAAPAPENARRDPD